MRLNSGRTILYSGQSINHVNGVAIIISKEVEKTLLQWQPVNDRLITARFDSNFCKLTLIQCYAPTNDADEEIKNEFYDQLQAVFDGVPQHDMVLITGDLNAKVGTENTNIEHVIGKHGCGTRNENGEELVVFCLMNRCVIGGTIFPHKNIHKLTWKSPDGITVNQIDHIITNSKWRRSLLDVRAYRGADVNSDHFLIQAVIQLKLRKTPHKENIRQRINIQQLKLPAIRRTFNLELKNRFSALDNFEEDNISNQYELIKETYLNTAKDTLGFQTKKNKE